MPKIKIIKSSPIMWYKDKIGHVYNVIDAGPTHYEFKTKYAIFKDDAEEIA
ncbi:hypothetical protein HN014_22535 (plasmid) [Aquimarina sp. TRL1]|uniref:hypothetical protein n=1 Tax=Aquimarina sp. (strain TRL1) TaxID=2736252 RepID=UPI00158DA42F|nr:hypothetical protein [Aquimarina sp. TRL1]QKX07780.1 hypothetical protein HN014_22535 [Aquimarina sp. TRL1]